MDFASELARVEAEIERLTTIRDYLRERAGARNHRPSTPRPRKPGKPPTAAQAAEEALTEAGRPMKTPELLLDVQRRGARISSSDNLYKTLSRSDRFVKAGRGLWTLAQG